jgi:hypothetical protein
LAHKHGHKHVHGQGELSIAFDEARGVFQLSLPAESAFGFEHKPKNEEEQSRLDKALSLLRENATELFVFDASLRCTWANPTVRVETKGSHADVFANYEVSCAKSPKGSSLKFQFREHMPRLRVLRVEFNIDGRQGKLNLKNGQGEMNL